MKTLSVILISLVFLMATSAYAADATPPTKTAVVVPAKIAKAVPAKVRVAVPAKTTKAVPAKAPAAAPVATVPAEPSVAASESKAPEKAAEKPTQDTQKWWQGLLVTVIESFVAVVMPILSILLMILIRKWNLKIEQDKVDWCLDKALGAGEQKLKQMLKDGKPIDAPGVKSAAVEHGTALLEKYGLAKKFGDWLADGIEARLGEKVVAAGGAKQPALKALITDPAEEKEG